MKTILVSLTVLLLGGGSFAADLASPRRLVDHLVSQTENLRPEILRLAFMAYAEGLEDGAEPYRLHELNARVQLLIAKIQRHESEENEIVLDAHWSDLGMGD